MKLCTIIVPDTVTQPTDFGFKRSRVRLEFRVMVRKSALICTFRECTNCTYLVVYLPGKAAPTMKCNRENRANRHCGSCTDHRASLLASDLTDIVLHHCHLITKEMDAYSYVSLQ